MLRELSRITTFAPSFFIAGRPWRDRTGWAIMKARLRTARILKAKRRRCFRR
jgi:hypothetical protein